MAEANPEVAAQLAAAIIIVRGERFCSAKDEKAAEDAVKLHRLCLEALERPARLELPTHWQ